jgi:hypothetical protein
MNEMNWSADETVRLFQVERALHPGLTSAEWAEVIAGRLAAACERRGEALAAADREQLAWLIGQHLDDALAASRRVGNVDVSEPGAMPPRARPRAPRPDGRSRRRVH